MVGSVPGLDRPQLLLSTTMPSVGDVPVSVVSGKQFRALCCILSVVLVAAIANRHYQLSTALQVIRSSGGVYGDVVYPLIGPSHYVSLGASRLPGNVDLAFDDDALLSTIPSVQQCWFLESISVSRCPGVTSRGGLALLRAMPHVREIVLSDTSVDDTLCASLTSDVEVDSLILDNTKVTFIGLLELSHIDSLRYLSVQGIPLTESESAELRMRLPRVRIRGYNREWPKQ